MTKTESHSFTTALTATLDREENTMTQYFTDARGTNIKHARCAHASTPQGRRQCRKAVKEILSQIAAAK